MTEPAENNQENIIEQAIQQFVDAQLRGQNPDINELVKQYPEFEDRIRQRIQNLQKIDGLFSCLMEADDSDFQDAATEHNLIGQTLGDFKILSIIGTGGMGAVFLAHQISLDRDVALKVISDISGARGKSIERFKREAKVLARISHPNIVPIYEVGQEGPYSYFAMEYVKGVSLNKVVDAVRKAPASQKASDVMSKCIAEGGIYVDGQAEVEGSGAEIDTDYIVSISRIIISIASALDYAHKQGVLHRDVKPSNILIKPDGTAKLVDFGLARAETQQTITVSGEFFGTPTYVSPEQIRKPETVDCRSDVYSLAATYYECLTLRPPFEGNTVNETLTRVISRPVVPPKKYCPRLSTDFNTVLMHALEKLPEDRYQTAADFAGDIENVLDFRPVTAKRPSITRRTYKTLRRNPLKVAFGLMLVIAVTLSFFVYSAYEKKIDAQRTAKVKQLLEDADLLLCQAALNTGPWPTIGNESVAERAYDKYNEALRIDENNWWALINRGIATLVMGENIKAALKDFEKAEQFNPNFKIMPYLKSKVWEQLKKEELRDITLDKVETLDFREAYILGLLALQQANPPENEQESLRLFNICIEKEPDFYPAVLAKVFVNSGSAEGANLEECRTLIRLRPNVAFVHILMGAILGARGELEEEAEEYKRACELQPWNPVCYHVLGDTLEGLGLGKQAEQNLLRACELEKSAHAYSALALYYRITKKDYKKSVDICEQGLRKKHNLVIKQMILNCQHFALEEMGATQELKQCIKEEEACMLSLMRARGGRDDPQLHSDFLNFLYDNKREEEAVKFYQEVCLRKPRFRFLVGTALMNAYELDNKIPEALALGESLYNEIKIGGLDTESNGGITYIEKINLLQRFAILKQLAGYTRDDVSKIWTELLAIYPHDGELWYKHGLSSMMDYETAINAFRQALRYIRNEKDRFEITCNLAATLYRGNHLDEAKQELTSLQYKLDSMKFYSPLDFWRYSKRVDMTSEDKAKTIYVILSDVYIAKHQTKEAKDTLKTAIERIHQNFELYRRLALAHTVCGETNEAIQVYFKYFDLLPITNDASWLILDLTYAADAVIAFTDLLIKENQLDKATEFIDRERKLNRKMSLPISPYTAPKYETSLYIAQAKVSLAENNLENAVDQLNKAIDIQPELYIAWDLLEKTYISRGLYDQARQAAEKAIKLNPKQSFGYQWLANVYFQMKKYDDAIHILQESLSFKPDDVVVLKTLGAAYVQLGRYEEAIPPLKTATALAPNDANALYSLATAYQGLKRYEDATKPLLAVSKLVPENAQVKLDLAMAYDLCRKYEEAIEQYKEYLTFKPRDVQAYLNLAADYHMTYRINEAIDTCKEIIRIDPNNVVAHARLTGHYRLLRDYPAAMKSAMAALRADPKDVEALVNVGAVYFDLENFDETVKLCKQAIEIKPNYWQAYAFLSASYQKKGMKNEAISVIEQFLAFDDKFFRAYQSLGIAYALSNRHEDAVKTFRRSIELEPNEIVSHQLLAKSLQTLGHREEAIESYNQVIKLDTKNAVAYAASAFLYAECGDFDKAVEYQKKAIELADDKAKQEYEKRLEAYKAKKPWRD